MQKNFKLSSIFVIQILLSVSFLFTSCSNLTEINSDKGQISLEFPTRISRSAKLSEVLTYKFFITNRDTNEKKEVTGPASDTIKIELNPGIYNIAVNIYHSSTPQQIFYEGEAKDVEVILGKSTNVNIKLKRLKQDWVIDLTPLIDFALLEENEWGTNGISDYQSESYVITELFNGILPKAGDTINFIWKGKCNMSLEELHIILADETGSGDTYKWVHLLSEETYSSPVITDIIAEENFEINTTLPISESSENNVKLFFAYGSDDFDGSSFLYNSDEYNVADYQLPEISMLQDSDFFYDIVHFTKPGDGYINTLKNKGCDGFIIGVASGLTPEGKDKWLFGNTYYLTDEDAFEDINLAFNLLNSQSQIEEGKISIILDFYKDVDLPEGERTWLKEFKSPEYENHFPPLTNPTLYYVDGEVLLDSNDTYFNDFLRNSCEFFYIGIATGYDERPSTNWLCLQGYRIEDTEFFRTNPAVLGFDFTSEINEEFKSKIKNGKVYPVMHIYVTYDEEKQTGKWMTEITGPEVNFTDLNP